MIAGGGEPLSWSQEVHLRDQKIRQQQEEIEHLKEKELQSLKARIKELENK